MKLSDKPFKELYVGLHVRSDSTGRFGMVCELLPKADDYRDEDNLVTIWWENSKFSHTWHYWTDKITIIEE